VQLSFEIQDKDTNLSLTANLLLLNASSENVTSDVLGFLLHGNEKLTVLTTSLLFEVVFCFDLYSFAIIPSFSQLPWWFLLAIFGMDD